MSNEFPPFLRSLSIESFFSFTPEKSMNVNFMIFPASAILTCTFFFQFLFHLSSRFTSGCMYGENNSKKNKKILLAFNRILIGYCRTTIVASRDAISRNYTLQNRSLAFIFLVTCCFCLFDE